MKKILFISFALLMVFGCTSTRNSDDTLYARYMSYYEIANAENIKRLAGDYFSPSSLEEIDMNDEKESEILLWYKHGDIYSHHEEIKNNKGCLSLNGFSANKSPFIFSIFYENTMKNWLITGGHIVYVKNAEKFVSQAVCSRDALMKILDD